MRSCGNFVFYTNPALSGEDLMGLFHRSGDACPMPRREKFDKLIQNSNLLLAAYVQNRLVGVVRALSDFCSCCYVADVVVDESYRNMGLREALLRQVRLEVDSEVELVVPFLAPSGSGQVLLVQ